VISSCDLQKFGTRRQAKKRFKSFEAIGVEREAIVFGEPQISAAGATRYTDPIVVCRVGRRTCSSARAVMRGAAFDLNLDLTQLRQIGGQCRKLVDRDPRSHEYRAERARTEMTLGGIQQGQRKLSDAEKNLRRGFEVFELSVETL